MTPSLLPCLKLASLARFVLSQPTPSVAVPVLWFLPTLHTILLLFCLNQQGGLLLLLLLLILFVLLQEWEARWPAFA